MNPISTQAANPAYTALRSGAAWQPRPAHGVLRLTGADRADFLHRMTTNEINGLRPGQSAVTVLTSPTARILQVFTVLCRQEGLLALPAAGQAGALLRHLRGQIFFMDQVKVEDVSELWARARLMGPQATAVAAALGFDLTQAADGAWQEQNGLLALRQAEYDLPGVELLAPAEQQAELAAKLAAAGAAPLDDAYLARRIELGRPAPGSELIEEYNPLEAGLGWACAQNKGCYTGQEIIARQITYDKVTKTLVGLRCALLPAAGSPVLAEGRAVGLVTSAAYSPALAAPLALAVVKRPHNIPGSKLTVEDALAEVVALPIAGGSAQEDKESEE